MALGAGVEPETDERIAQQVMWREDRRSDAKATAVAAAAFWPDDEETGTNLDAVKRKVRKQGLGEEGREPSPAGTAAAAMLDCAAG